MGVPPTQHDYEKIWSFDAVFSIFPNNVNRSIIWWRFLQVYRAVSVPRKLAKQPVNQQLSLGVWGGFFSFCSRALPHFVPFPTSRHLNLSLLEIHHTTRVAFCFLLPLPVAFMHEYRGAGVKGSIVQVESEAETPRKFYVSQGMLERKWVSLCKLLRSCLHCGSF